MFILSILTENFLLINVGEKHINIDNNEILTIAENLSNKFLNDFFKNKNVLTNEEYLKKFKIKTNEFGWIFNPNGIKKSINKDEKFAFKMFNNLNALENDLKGVKNDLNDILKDDYLINQEDSNENNNNIKNEDFYLVHDSTNAIFEFDADFNENETENKNIINNNNINNEDFYLEHDSTNGLYDLEA